MVAATGAEVMVSIAVISAAASAVSTIVIVGGAHPITNGSAIDEPRLRPFGGAANRGTHRSMQSYSHWTKHFQEIHGADQHREGSPALLLARWPTALCFGCIPPTPRVWFSTRLSSRLKPLVGGDGSRRHGRSTLGVEPITSPRSSTYATRADHVAALLTFQLRVSSGRPSPGPLISIPRPR